MGRCLNTVIYQKCVIFYKHWQQLLVKRSLVKKLLSILHRLQIKTDETDETLTGSKSTCPTVLHLLFLFHNKSSITIHKLKKWITILACFRIGNISYTVLSFKDCYCNKALQAKVSSFKWEWKRRKFKEDFKNIFFTTQKFSQSL